MTMRHLTLICMAGISTSLLVNKMKRLIRNENLEIAVTAMSERAFQGYTGSGAFRSNGCEGCTGAGISRPVWTNR